MAQSISYNFPALTVTIFLDSCVISFKNYYISGTALTSMNSQNIATNISISMLSDYNNLTSDQKLIVKSWEKMKIAKILNNVILKISGTLGTLTYNDISDSWFS